MEIACIARASKLSQVQVREVLALLQKIDANICFAIQCIQSHGDIDLKTSLRDLGQTDFFTKEMDEALLNNEARIAIHSAKDLPSPLCKGLSIAAITHGVDPSDCLVMKPGSAFDTIPLGGVIATSSQRRDEVIRHLRPDLVCCDIRGTIESRLKALDDTSIDGVVIAKAALIRLDLLHLNWMSLPGETAANQGKLAIVCREEDLEMRDLFEAIDARIISRT
ncbi:MAG: hydroxymethylbilane synthase [Simkaniaceae bacterium]|nr:hydroxymethylbilane synthase [Simkaniaceae bacterium]MCF7852486.1 hydroxymethylbilane synthase [Simkaniaceae bacterium]